ncbi:MAG: hypothetical protein OEZ36_10165, partial [Spirochaetota bacterium]|nr:hypothetical protein [Spirochaetota bacterium]
PETPGDKSLYVSVPKELNLVNKAGVSELKSFFLDMDTSLKTFFTVLLEELDRENPNESRILSSKELLEECHPYLRFIYEKEDLWYKRKPSKTRDDLYIYSNILLRVSRNALQWLKKALLSLTD